MPEAKSIAANRAAAYKPAPRERKPKRELKLDNLVPLPEGEYEKLTMRLQMARKAGEAIRAKHGDITKDMTNLWEDCKIRLGGDKELLKTLSLSEGMLVVYGTPANVDQVFGGGCFKETKTSASSGASSWRKPWSLIRTREFGEAHTTSPADKFNNACVAAVKSGELSYTRALALMNRAWGKS